jgi:hypothetical protein
MNVKGFEPMLRDATIKALDKVGERLAGAEVATENAVTRLLNRWNSLDRAEKENVASIVIATAITAVSAVGALRKGKARTAKNVGKRVMKRVARKMAD